MIRYLNHGSGHGLGRRRFPAGRVAVASLAFLLFLRVLCRVIVVVVVVVVVVMVLFVLRISLLSRSSSARTFEVSSGGLLITRDIRSLNQFLRLSSTW